jgi:Flp pilus assembly protein TadG
MTFNSSNTFVQRFKQSRSGNFAVSFALLLPVLMGLVGGTIDFLAFKTQQADMQNIADAAVLAAAREGSLKGWTDEVAVTVAQQFALDKMKVTAEVSTETVVVAKAVAGPSKKEVSITLEMDHYPYFLMGYFAPSPQISVTSSATVSGEMNTCIIGLDPALDATVSLTGLSKLTAPDCAVYSNSVSPKGFASVDLAYLDSALNCSAGGVEGATKNFATPPTLDCRQIPDPLVDRVKPNTTGCDFTDKVVSAKITVLKPGIYCGGISIKNLANVLFLPGVYVIKDGELLSTLGGISAGYGVSFYFTGEGSRFNFEATTTIAFSAPETGNMAGILFYQDPAMVDTLTYEISSIKAGVLLGTIYLPNGIFKVHANNKVGDQSAYTVIVAKQLDIGGGADLVVNANYSATKVPVPEGLGPSKKIRLLN